MTVDNIWEQILDYSHRANPYPLYAELRRTPVARLQDGAYVASGYAEIAALLHDPRVSSDFSHNPVAAAAAAGENGDGPGMSPTFLSMDPPDHDKFRRITMRHFGPPTTPGRVAGMEPRMTDIVTDLIDKMEGRTSVDIVDELAYPLPVTIICELLGVAPGDEHRFRAWVEVALQSTDPGLDPETQQKKRAEAGKELRAFMEELVEAHRQAPGNDLLSALATDDGPEGRMPADQLVSTGLLLLIAGHETTVNLISNGILTLLRHPHELRRLRNDPDLAIPMVEELLRYEPPVHFIPFRTALDDIDIGGTTITAGSSITLLLAAGNRDPAHVADPDVFIPERRDNQHLGFGGGIHLCFGAPSRDSRRRPHSRHLPAGSRTRGSWRIRRATGRARSCAGLRTCRSTSTASWRGARPPRRPIPGWRGPPERTRF